MKDWSIDILKDTWVKLGCFLTGYSYTLIRNSSESSRKTVKKFLSAIILVGAVWSAVGFLFAERYFEANRLQSIMAGIAMFIIVVQIERQIILTTTLTFWGKFSRVLLGLLMALIGATVIDQIMFQDDVERYKRDNADAVIEKRIASQKYDLSKWISKNDSIILVLNQEINVLTIEALKKPFDTKTEIRTISVTDSTGKILERKNDIITIQVRNPKFEIVDKKEEQILFFENENNEFQKRMSTLREDQLEKYILESDGFLTELEYLFQILKERTIAKYFYLLWFSLLVLIEMLVLITKSGTGSTDYEKLIQHQSDINKQAIKSLSEIS